MARAARLAALAAALVLLSAPGAWAYDLLLLRQDWAPNAPFDPSCANNGCANKLDYGAFTVRDLAPSMTSTLGLAVCPGPSFDAGAIPSDVRSALGCVLSEVESVWEAVWNNQGRCSGLNVTAYFTFLAASFNLFSANTALADNTELQLPAVDRDMLVAGLKEAWGVQPWVSCNPASKSLLWVSLCLSPGAAAAGVALPVDCPWDPTANVAGGVECSGQLTLTRGQQPPPTCSPYFPATLDAVVPVEAGGGGAGGAAFGTAPVESLVNETLAAPTTDAALAAPSGGGAAGDSDGGSAAGSSAASSADQAPPERAEKPESALPASWEGLADLPSELNPGAAAVSTGADFLRAMAEGLGDITLTGDIALAPGDFHFQEYSLPLNVSGAVWLHAADPSAPVILDWSNVSGLVNVYEDSTLVLEGVVSQNVGDGAKAIASRTVRVEVKGSPLWPTVTGANGHRVLLLDSYLVVPQPVLFRECLEVLQNSSWPFAGDGGDSLGGVFYDNLTVVTSSLALVDVEQLPDLGVGGDSSYSPGRALYSLARTSAGPSTPDSPAPTPDPVASSGSGLSAGAIAGIAAGAAVAAVALAAACVVWRRRRGRAQQVAAAPKCAPPSPRLTPKSHSLDSKDGTGNGTGTNGTAACTTVVIHLDSDDASSQAAATASADSVVLAAGGLAPLVGGSAAKARGHSALARAIARQQSDTSGSPPGTAHSVLPGGRDNPFNSTGTMEARGGSTGESEGDDLFLSYIRTRQHGGSSPGSGTSPGQTPAFSRQSSLAAGPGRRAALSSQESALWAIPFEQLELEEKIGEGAFGRVYRAEWHATPVAVKVLLAQAQLQDTGSLAEALAQPSPVLTRLQEEADLMFSLRHPNCVQLMGTCLAPPCLVTEYCSRGSMADCLRAARRSSKAAAALNWRRRLAMALDAAKGMLYLHSYQPPIVHRDLKSPNLLVDKDWNVKVADFNLSKILGEDASASQEVTNPRWLAPEVLQGEAAAPPSDVFSFGVVLWELLTFHLPWCHDQLAESANPWQLARMVLAGARLPVPPPELLPGDALPPPLLASYTALMQGCWVEAAEERPTFAGIAAALRDMLQQLESGAHA